MSRTPTNLKNRDELYEQAVDIVIREGRGSVSLLQRALGIGYGRAARLIDYMAEDGIVGQYNGSQAREVMITLEQWAAMSGQADGRTCGRGALPWRCCNDRAKRGRINQAQAQSNSAGCRC